MGALSIGTASAVEIVWTLVGQGGLVVILRLLAEARIDHAVQLDRFGRERTALAYAGVLTARRFIVLHRTLTVVLGILTLIGIIACLTPAPPQTDRQTRSDLIGLLLVIVEGLLAWLPVYLTRSRDHVRRVIAGDVPLDVAVPSSQDEQHGTDRLAPKNEGNGSAP